MDKILLREQFLLTPILSIFSLSATLIDSSSGIELASLLVEFFFCQLPLFEQEIEISLDVPCAWEIAVTNPQSGEFCQIIITDTFPQEAVDDRAIAFFLGMLLIWLGHG